MVLSPFYHSGPWSKSLAQATQLVTLCSSYSGVCPGESSRWHQLACFLLSGRTGISQGNLPKVCTVPLDSRKELTPRLPLDTLLFFLEFLGLSSYCLLRMEYYLWEVTLIRILLELHFLVRFFVFWAAPGLKPGMWHVNSSLWHEGSSSLRACVLIRFSWVQLSATLWTVAHQGPLSMGFSRQEYWSGLPCPSPGDFPDPGIERGSCIGNLSHLDHQGSPSCVISAWLEIFFCFSSLSIQSDLFPTISLCRKWSLFILVR